MEAQRAHGPTKGNRRSERRRRVYKCARIVFNNGYAVFDCIVRNVSAGGAMLEMETLLGIPGAFRIVMGQDAAPRPCRVIWRTERRMGVAFGDALTKRRWPPLRALAANPSVRGLRAG